MKFSKTPIVSTWLLENFLSSSADTALKGDLVERYARGRSRVWYWKQVISAILIGCWKDTSAHKLLAFRALGVGFAIVYLETWLWRYVVGLWISLLRGSPSFMVFPFPGLAVLLIEAVMFALPGWVVARFHRPQAMAMVLLFTTLMELPRSMFIVDSYRLLLDSFSHPRFVPYLAGSLAQWLLAPICTVLAGLWADASEKSHSPETPEVIS